VDYRPRIRPRPINRIQSPATGPGFSKISISSTYVVPLPHPFFKKYTLKKKYIHFFLA